ncbi:hypothetical protein PIB30_049968 [Stylosanthes scabra]|uniref:F-box domain-containing protein n=1 Tax=Stylosanthes scabra TaxID=79078 RepID=A0ABU6YHQ2_9FABA|nr:hypothetical protein [Stylosanthes scabra]
MTTNLDTNTLPILPNDVITYIFIKSDSKTFARSRTIASFWNTALTKEETVNEHINNVYGPCILLQFNHPMMLFPLGQMFIWRLNTNDHACLRFPYRWEWLSVIGSNRGYVFARYSLDRRTSKIIIWNPITNNTRHISDPGSSNASNNRSITDLAIYSVVNVEGTRHFLIIALHRSSNFDTPYNMEIYDSMFNN